MAQDLNPFQQDLTQKFNKFRCSIGFDPLSIGFDNFIKFMTQDLTPFQQDLIILLTNI